MRVALVWDNGNFFFTVTAISSNQYYVFGKHKQNVSYHVVHMREVK